MYVYAFSDRKVLLLSNSWPSFPGCLAYYSDELQSGSGLPAAAAVNKRKSLYGPASKTMVEHAYSVHHCDRFMYWRMYACNRFVLPTLTQRLLNIKNKKDL